MNPSVDSFTAFCSMKTSHSLCCQLKVTEVYQERRLDAVFAMWDQNSDLRISFKELCEGLYRWASTHCVADGPILCTCNAVVKEAAVFV